MNRLGVITACTLLLFFLSGCRSSKIARNNATSEERILVNTLLADPAPTEFTASVSFNLSGRKVNGQIRMRRDRCIQLSASLLGLMEVARVEFFPDRVVVMDRVHNLYSVCHYADIPYRNELGLDFNVVQAILWNRIFSPGSANSVDASTRIFYQNTTPDGIIALKDMECSYTFLSDGRHLLSTLKEVSGFRFRLDYSDFTAISKDFEYPLEQTYSLDSSSTDFDVVIRLSSAQSGKGSWPDQTQVGRRMKQVTLDELLEYLNL